MKFIFFKFTVFFSLILLQTNGISAKQPLKIVTYDGIARYADRFEFLPSDDCRSFEMRSWGRIIDKESNALAPDDIVSLNLHSGPFNIAQVARVLSISKHIDDKFDVVYLSFGNWSWDTEKVFQDLAIKSLTAVHFDRKANIEANIWNTPELPKKLKNLRESCSEIAKVGDI
mgnify:CR=1 FL=1